MRLISATLRATVAVSALCSLGLAMILPTPGAIDTSLIRRGLQIPVSGLPACNGPSATGTSNYVDGEGVFVGNSCDKETSDFLELGKGGVKCTTEYFLVGTTDAYNQWYQANGNIDCPPEGSCAKAVQKLSQTCTSFQWSVTESVSVEVDLELVKIGTSISSTQGQIYQSCNADTSTDTCTWTDGQCHSIWAAQQITTVHGYMRESCTIDPSVVLWLASEAQAKGETFPQQRPDGNFTAGMQDFEFPLAGVSAITCDGTCNPAYNPGPPPAGHAMTPWPTQ